MKWDIPAFAAHILHELNTAGYEAYIVGGCVRDILCDRTPKDWDITTSATPEQVKAVLSCRTADTGIAHGTVTAIGDTDTVEITTYRIEQGYSDHRHPDAVQYTLSLKEDLARRDFTINAMAYHPDAGLIDFFGGCEDLGRRRLRCVGDPNLRFEEDALRILRALRFASSLQLRIDPATAEAIHRKRELLNTVASERVYSELTKLICGSGARAVLTEFVDAVGVCIPELLATVGFDQHSPYHNYPVYEHTLRALEALPSCAYLRWTILLHDLGKPACFTLDAAHRGHFAGHEQIGADMADTILTRLHASNALRERVTLLIRHHDADLELNETCLTKWLHRIGETALLQLILIQKADDFAKSTLVKYRREKYDRLYKEVERLIKNGACYSLKTLCVSGNDLIALGYRADTTLGDTLDRLLNAVMDGDCPNERDALLALAAQWRA